MEKQCYSVFLTADSFVDDPVCEKYFRHFVKQHKVYFPEQFTENYSYLKSLVLNIFTYLCTFQFSQRLT